MLFRMTRRGVAILPNFRGDDSPSHRPNGMTRYRGDVRDAFADWERTTVTLGSVLDP